jgi:predicted Fe-Mo cluster-binding NifX family protein
MKVAVTSRGRTLEDQIDPRFGRCAHFVIVDTADMSFQAIDNANAAAGGGAGIQSAQLVSGQGVGVVLTGNCGPNAYRALEAAGVEVVIGVGGTVKDAVEQYRAGKLSAAGGPNVRSHSGLTDGSA